MSEDGRVVDLEAYRRLGQRLRGGSDDGHDGGMPPDLVARVTALEGKVDGLVTDMRAVKADTQKLREDVAEIKGRLTHVPTVAQLIYGNVGLAIGIAGLVFTIARAVR